uniref:WD_REPEATS_REGION domain-containing protein n=1 Tax=Macrostomum lignano TaxID=282301 RepID=A0A1I8FRD7_9PLAT
PLSRHNVPAKPLVVNLALCDQVGDASFDVRLRSPGQTTERRVSRLRINILHRLLNSVRRNRERLRVMLSGVVERLDRLDRHVIEARSGAYWAAGTTCTQLAADKSVKMWQVSSSNELLKTLDGHDGPVLSLAPDCSVLFLLDRRIIQFEFGMVHPRVCGVRYLLEAPLCVSKLYLFSGSFTLVKVWDLASRICLRTLTWISCAAGSPPLVVSQQLLYVSCLSVMRTSAGLKLLSGSHDMSVALK